MSDNMRVVLAGCGGISGAWLEAAAKMDDLEVVGLVDLDENAARKNAGEYGLPEAFVGTDIEEALNQARPDIVFDCTVPEAHVMVTLAALGHGCHVLGEKPLADSMHNARKMVKAANDAGRIYAVMQNRRFDWRIRRLRAFLE